MWRVYNGGVRRVGMNVYSNIEYRVQQMRNNVKAASNISFVKFFLNDLMLKIEERDPRISRGCLLLEDFEMLSRNKFKFYLCLDDTGLIIEQSKNVRGEDTALVRPYDVKKRHICLWSDLISPPSNISPTKIKCYFRSLCDSVLHAIPELCVRNSLGGVEFVFSSGTIAMIVPMFHFKKYWPISALRYLEFYCREWNLSFQEIINTGFYTVPAKIQHDASNSQVDDYWEFDVTKVHNYFNKIPSVGEYVDVMKDLVSFQSPDHDFLNELINSVVLRALTRINQRLYSDMSRGKLINMLMVNMIQILSNESYKSPFYEKNIIYPADLNSKFAFAHSLMKMLQSLVL